MNERMSYSDARTLGFNPAVAFFQSVHPAAWYAATFALGFVAHAILF